MLAMRTTADPIWCVRFGAALLSMFGAHFASATSVAAQALVPPQGEGTVSVTYQNYYTTGHFDLVGHENTNGATHTKALAVELDYGISDTIGFVVSLPLIASKYTGPASYPVAGIETFPGPLDDRAYHAAVQDLRVEVRRMFLTGPVAVTPFVAVSLPTHGYETVGEAVPGRRRRELQLGASAAAPLDHVLPGAYVHVRYSLGAAERIQGLSAVRSNIDLEGGYAVTSRVAFRGVFIWQIRNSGPLAPELAHDWVNHDRFIVGDYLNAGGGATVSLTESMEVHALWISTVSGKNGAHAAQAFSVGASWSFGRGFAGLGGSLN